MLVLLLLPLAALATSQVPDSLLEDLLADLERQQYGEPGDYQYSDYDADTQSPALPVAPVAPRSLQQEDIRQKKQIHSSMLPAYCNPPNPCPVGYTAQDGCIPTCDSCTDAACRGGCFDNNSGFSQRYQASQSCMCDTEHMFTCPDQAATQPGLFGLTAEEIKNPFLYGEKLASVGKKGMGY